MSKPKLPPLSEVLALAEQADCRVSITDLARMHKHCEFSEVVVDALWPDATARRRAMLTGHKRYVGVPCNTCGGTLRNVASNTCTPCQNERRRGQKYASNWHAENRDYLRLYLKAWRLRRKEMAA